MTTRRVAIVHDWLTSMRGAERMLESLCRLYPAAVLHTLRYDRERVSPTIAAMEVRTSFVDRIPWAKNRFRALLPLFPMAVESFDLDDFDLVISTSHCVAKGALAKPGALHVSYVHAPMRYVWDGRNAYAERVPGGPIGQLAAAAAAHYLRLWDVAATPRADVLIANSAYTREKLRRYYGRDAQVIEPPVDTTRFEALAANILPRAPRLAGDPGFFLVVSALVPYKRVELAVRAFAGRREHLVIVGEGPERARLAAMATGNVELLGWVGDARLDDLYARARAIVHPALDDFGMVPVEAMAAGKPVVAFGQGGAAESVIDGETGVLFDEPTAASLAAAVDRLGRLRLEPQALKARARAFDRVQFESRLGTYIEACWDRHRGQGSSGPRALRGVG